MNAISQRHELVNLMEKGFTVKEVALAMQITEEDANSLIKDELAFRIDLEDGLLDEDAMDSGYFAQAAIDDDDRVGAWDPDWDDLDESDDDMDGDSSFERWCRARRI